MTGPQDRNVLSDEQRKTFARLANVLIPRSGRMPAASEAGAASYWLDRVLESRPDMVGALIRILDAAGGLDARSAILRLERDCPEDFTTLFTAAAGGYYMSDGVRNLLGYEGQRAIGPEEAPRKRLKDLVEPVVERGPIYREDQ